jgi:hypothetical protein
MCRRGAASLSLSVAFLLHDPDADLALDWVLWCRHVSAP